MKGKFQFFHTNPKEPFLAFNLTLRGFGKMCRIISSLAAEKAFPLFLLIKLAGRDNHRETATTRQIMQLRKVDANETKTIFLSLIDEGNEPEHMANE